MESACAPGRRSAGEVTVATVTIAVHDRARRWVDSGAAASLRAASSSLDCLPAG